MLFPSSRTVGQIEIAVENIAPSIQLYQNYHDKHVLADKFGKQMEFINCSNKMSI